MSSFTYGKHTKKHIGVWLRWESNPDIIKLIKKSENKRFYETIQRVVIHEYDKKENKVWLEVWCQNPYDIPRKKHRYNVFYIKTKINENWICEGDLGCGIKF